MQKYLLLSLLATILGLLPLHAQNEFDPSKEFTQGDFKYYIWDEENRELSLVGYTGESNSDVIIPEIVSQNDTEYTVKYVVCLGYKAIKSLHISSSVIEVNHDLFSWSPITDQFSVAPDNDVYTSYEGSLYSRDMTKLCAIPTNTEELIIPEGVTSIGENACYSSILSSVALPESLISIESDAFSWCRELSQINLPQNLEQIGTSAFRYCSLREIYIPQKAILDTSDGGASPVFFMCPLETISVHPQNPNYSVYDGCLYSKDYSSLLICPRSKDRITFPSVGVKEIAECAFLDCSDIHTITIPNTIENIQDAAFCRSGLDEVTLPESITVIKPATFSQCERLSRVNLPKKLSEVCEQAFASCPNLGTIVIPANVSKISVSSFDSCDNAKILILSNDINISTDNDINENSQPTYYADEASGMFHYLKWIMEQYRPNATVKPLPDVFGGMDFFIGPDSEHTGMGWGFALEPASGFQADLTMPAGLSLTDVSLYGAVTDFKKLENGDYRIICYKSDNTVFQDYDNIGLDLKSDETLERGKILFHNIILSIDGTEYSVADKEAGISGYDVRFDNIPESAEEGDTLPLPNPLSKIYDDVSYNWQMHPGELGTITDNNAITFHKAGEVVLSAYVSDPNMNTSWSLHMGTITITPALWGDSNSSGAIDLADVVTTVNHILERNPEPFNAKLADVDRNGRINIVDVTSTVKLVLEQPIPDTPESDTQGAPAARELAFSEISRLENGKNILSLNLKPSADYTALQTDLEVPADVAIEAISLGTGLSRHTVDYATVAPGVTRVILYSPSLTELAAGEEQPVLNITLGELPANGTIRTLRTLACDAQGQSFTLGNAEKEFYTTTGISSAATANYNVRAIAGGIEISGAEGAAITVSDLQGRTVATAAGATTATRLSLAPGVYLVSATGQHPAKILVK